jgi:hypothetical protein
MVLAEDIEILSTFNAADLTEGIRITGYRGDRFTSAKFLGITNGGQFCYKVKYFDKEMGIEQTTKVFVDVCPETGATRVDY